MKVVYSTNTDEVYVGTDDWVDFCTIDKQKLRLNEESPRCL